eukprot:6175460-Pyramimonas_sp.AAC.1
MRPRVVVPDLDRSRATYTSPVIDRGLGTGMPPRKADVGRSGRAPRVRGPSGCSMQRRGYTHVAARGP